MEFKEYLYPSINRKVLKMTHKSGLEIIVIPQKGYSQYYATFSTKFGSINTRFTPPNGEEIRTTEGVAHFLEHKVFEMEDGTNAFDYFAKYGANANAFTSFAVTNYLFSCTDSFYENLEILLDFVTKPYFTEENVEKEKGIIAQEIRMYNDDPNQVCFYNCLKAMYKNHPVKEDIAGSVEDIMKITPQELYKCYNTFYHPSNMALICLGDVDENKILEIVDKYIDKEKTGKITQIFPSEPKETVQEEISTAMDVPLPLFTIGFKDNENNLEKRELLKKELASGILLDMLFSQSSLIYTDLYEKGLIQSDFSSSYDYEESFSFAMLSGSSNDVKKVRDSIKEELLKVKNKGLDREAFERQKKVSYASFIRSLNDIEDLGNDFVFAHHKNIDIFETAEIIEEIDYDYLQKRFNTLFDEKNMVLSEVKSK